MPPGPPSPPPPFVNFVNYKSNTIVFFTLLVGWLPPGGPQIRGLPLPPPSQACPAEGLSVDTGPGGQGVPLGHRVAVGAGECAPGVHTLPAPPLLQAWATRSGSWNSLAADGEVGRGRWGGSAAVGRILRHLLVGQPSPVFLGLSDRSCPLD